jgi:DHA1 family bicyclomycin/chloramphenicol resistance-like MFS transporter
MGYALTGAFQFSALFSFLSGSPFVFIERYGVSPRLYGVIFGAQVVFLTLGSLTNARFVPRVGAQRMLRNAVVMPAIVGPAVLVMGLVEARTGWIGLWPFLPLFVLQIASNSFVGANAIAMALQRYPHMAGTASSLMGVMQFGLGALFGAIVGQAFAGSIVPMTTAMGIAGVCSFLSNRLVVGRVR